ncbi:hypothetical protein Trydic_g256 [Trypoxylus dichotomus]
MVVKKEPSTAIGTYALNFVYNNVHRDKYVPCFFRSLTCSMQCRKCYITECTYSVLRDLVWGCHGLPRWNSHQHRSA